MNIGGSEGFSANWGTEGHSAGAVIGSTIGYLDSLGRVMSGWHTAEDNTQNANRLTLLSTDGEIVGKNLTEKEIEELLVAQEEARKIAEKKEQEENLSDYDFDGTIGKNPQEYDFEGTIGKDKIELANKQKKQNNLLEKKSFFSNHEVFTSYQSKDGADALYADAGMNLDYENGNFNLNAEAGFVSYEKTWEVSDSKEFNFGFTGRASGIAGDAMIGMEGSLFGTRADMHVYKGGGTIDITLWGVTTSIGGDVMVGGIGGGVLLGKEGFKASLDLGVGVGAQVTWRKKK